MLFTLFLLVMMITMLLGFEARWTLFIFIPATFFIFSTIFIRYTFEILNHSLVFEIRLFGVKIYRKEMVLSSIKKIIFKRVAWGKRCAIVKNQTGFNVRIVDVYPKDVFNDLLTFANHYDIPVIRTNEYNMLENKRHSS